MYYFLYCLFPQQDAFIISSFYLMAPRIREHYYDNGNERSVSSSRNCSLMYQITSPLLASDIQCSWVVRHNTFKLKEKNC